MSGIWLNIGCGKKHLSGFVNMDIAQPYDKKLDARKGLPYSDHAVDGVYSEHFFEHLTQAEGLGFLRECRRVLKPGGAVRIAMPDLDELVNRYISEDWRGNGDMFKLGFDWVVNRCEMLNIAMREWGHKHVYNEEELVRIAQASGLQPIKRCEHGKSDTPEFVGRETRNGSKLIMEFIKLDRRLATDAMPLASILIPSYNPRFFREALESAINQSYQNIEIIVCDDCETDGVEKIMEGYKTNARVHYFKNPTRLMGRENLKMCFNLARGEFIKFLNDDDLLHPDCISRMLDCYRQFPDVALVTSYRQLIDENGRLLPDIFATARLMQETALIEGTKLASLAISSRVNFIGEPSTVLFRKRDLEHVTPDILSFGGNGDIRGLGDLAMWLNLLCIGNASYIPDAMSYFRIHPAQRQRAPDIPAMVKKSWGHLWKAGKRLGLVGRPINQAVPTLGLGEGHWKTQYFSRLNLQIRLVAILGSLYQWGYALLRRCYFWALQRGLVKNLT